MKAPIISVKNVSKTFYNVKAVRNLSFDVKEASCFGFLGPNGAGKTTMMKMIYGKALRDDFYRSSINVMGFDPAVDSLSIKELSGVVPQEDNLDEEINVYQNLFIYSRFYAIPHDEAKKRIENLLDFMELSDKKKSMIKELSGGMKRRLIIARALLNNPRLLILDEPTTGLDPQVRHTIWDKLRRLKKEGVTMLLTTHYMEEAFEICDQIIIMDKGEKVLEGNPRKLLDKHIEKYILQIINKKKAFCLEKSLNPKKVRKEETGEMVIYASDDLKYLENLANCLNSSDFYIRQSNLEDLFLKMTGRSLNEDQ